MNASGPAPQQALDLQDLLRVVSRRRWLLVIPWVVAVVIGVLAAFLLPPLYFSTVQMQFQNPTALTGQLGGMVGGGPTGDQQLNIMRGQIESSMFLRGIVVASGVEHDPATRVWALKHAGKRTLGTTPDEKVESVLIDFLRDAITLKVTKGDFIAVTVGAHEPRRAQRLTQAVADQFVLSSKSAQIEALRQTGEFASEQLQVYKQKLDDAERRLEGARRSAVSSTLEGSSVNGGNLAQARALLEQADLEIEQQRQREASTRDRLNGLAQPGDAAALTSPEVTSLASQLAGLERQLAAALIGAAAPGGGADGGASVRTLLARKSVELEDALDRSAARAFPSMAPSTRDLLVRLRLDQADIEARQARRAYLAGQVGAFERQATMAPDVEMELQRLQAEVDNARALYNSFLQQSAVNQISEAFQSAKVSGRFVVIEPADLPDGPGKPNRVVVIVLAVLAGGIIGLGTVLVVEQHDQSVRNAEEVENLLGLPVLGAVPRVDELERSRRRPRGQAAAAPLPAQDQGLLHRLKVESLLGLEFRRIYLKLARTRGRTMPRTLLVTSATRGEGKTTTSACLGITLSRELNERTLLVDFDLRSPSLHRALGLPASSWGLAQMLATRTFDERHVRTTVVPTLDFLAAGRSEQPAAELVDLAAVEWFLQEATKRYNLVVIDGPPNLAVPDPLLLGRAVEGVLYVIKAGSTVRKAAEYGVKVQREARDNVVGVLMNDIGDVLPHYYGYKHYGYGAPDEATAGDSS
jgi:succinoglycan biosynthesis transport protein ExoP